MREQLIYVVMQRAQGNLVMTSKAFDTLVKANAYMKTLNMSLGIHSEYYIEKCYLEIREK